MNEYERSEFERLIKFALNHLGDEISKPIGVGIRYYRGVEVRCRELEVEVERLRVLVSELEGSKALTAKIMSDAEVVWDREEKCLGVSVNGESGSRVALPHTARVSTFGALERGKVGFFRRIIGRIWG